MTGKAANGSSNSIILILVLCAIAAALSSAAFAADWPHWRGPNYNGISEETGWLTEWPEAGPPVLWKKTIGVGFSTISVADGKAYTMGNTDNTDTVFCFDAETGEELWKHTYPQDLDPKYYEGGTLATPTVADGKVYTVSKDGKAFCLDAKSGAELWKKNILEDYDIKRTTWGISGSPFIFEDLVIYNASDAGLALKKNDGALVWKNGAGPGGYSTAVPFTSAGKKCLTIASEKHIVGVVAATGEVLWKQRWQTQYEVNAADPIIVDSNTFFISSGYNRGCALMKVTDGKTELLWDNKNIKNKMNASVLWKGCVYGVGEDGVLACLDVKTGQGKWEQRGFGQGSITIAGGKLVVLGEKGNLVIAEPTPEKYNPISEADILDGKCWTVPVLANGRLYARDTTKETGHLVCLDLKPKTE